MAYPTDDLTNTHLDASTDDPSQARAELNALLIKVQAMIAATGTGANDALKLDSNGDVPTGVGLADALAIASGGTGAATAAAALVNFGLTALAAEINYNDISTLGDTQSSKVVTTNASGNTNHAGVMTFDAGKGIVFNGDAIAAANTLDDYEEGTWTPVVSDGTFNASTYSFQVGHYVKVGKVVNIRGYVRTSDLGSVAGSIRITGLPFTSDSTASSYGSMHMSQGLGLAITAGEQICGYVSPSTTFISCRLWDTTAGTSSLTSAEWSANGGIFFAGIYEV